MNDANELFRIGDPVIFEHSGVFFIGVYNGDNQCAAGNCLYTSYDIRRIENGIDVVKQQEEIK
jgi:hypothetical protein